MNVAELIDILNDLDPDATVEMSIVAPVDSADDNITVERYLIDGVLPRRPDDHDGESVVWFIGGESDDVEELIDAIDSDDESGDENNDQNDDENGESVVELTWERD